MLPVVFACWWKLKKERYEKQRNGYCKWLKSFLSLSSASLTCSETNNKKAAIYVYILENICWCFRRAGVLHLQCIMVFNIQKFIQYVTIKRPCIHKDVKAKEIRHALYAFDVIYSSPFGSEGVEIFFRQKENEKKMKPNKTHTQVKNG